MPKPIRKPSSRGLYAAPTSSPLSNSKVRFSDEISSTDGRSSSLEEKYQEKYPRYDDENDGRRAGGKIVKTRGPDGGLTAEELKQGVWIKTCVKEFCVAENEASFKARRWRMFGTKIAD